MEPKALAGCNVTGILFITLSLAMLASCTSDREASLDQTKAAVSGVTLEQSPWFAEVKQRIENEQNRISSQGERLHAVNASTGLRFWFEEDGAVTVEPAASEDASGVSFALAGLGREGGVDAAAAGRVALGECADDGAVGVTGDCLRDVEVTGAGFVERFVNGSQGMEQEIELLARPRGAGSLRVDVAITGGAAAESGDADLLEVLVGDARLCGAMLVGVKDADGRELAASLGATDGGMSVEVQDTGAAYPISIGISWGAHDFVPLSLDTSAAWSKTSPQFNAGFGFSVGSAGDVNNDGRDDVFVGAYKYDNGQADEGKVYVFYGSAAGPSTSSSWGAESNQAGANLGLSVVGAGDVNGDGYDDLIIGSHKYDNGQTDEGRVYLYYGSATGLAGGGAPWTAESDQASAYFGISVGGGCDVNNDGYDDIIVGAHYYDNGELNEGRAYIYPGSATGPGTSWILEPNQIGALFGVAVACAGDVNGDGFDDVAVGASMYDNGQTNEGRVFVYPGSASGLGTAWTVESDQVNAYFGKAVAGAGDVNGDGYDDIVVGAPNYDNVETDEGRAYLFNGSASGPAATASWTAESNQASAYFGSAVAGAGDTNGDGFADVLVAAPYYDNGETDEGKVWMYSGAAAGLAATASWTQEGNSPAAFFGVSVASAGDVNGDGFADVIVGNDYCDLNDGAATVFLGAADSSIGDTAEGNQASAYFGYAVAGAGDVNTDGFDDIAVGAYMFDNGQTNEGRAFVFHGSAAGLSTTASWTAESNTAGARFGSAVSAAGDVNGDGYDDLIVGAPYLSNGQGGEGRAYLYYGSATGLAGGGAPWTAESNQVSAYLGNSVGGGCDVNNDGYDDVAVGAYYYDNGQTNEGAAWVYPGSASGPGSPWLLEADQASAYFGVAVACAGDVNGDGYGDVVIGAHLYDNGQTNEGRAFVYPGSTSGPGTPWTVESNQATGYLGMAVAGAGDVNNDGYDDVIVGAPSFSNGQTDEGRAYLYQGSASGLVTTASWIAEPNQAGALFGTAVAGAGDVNNDGFDDVAVGAYMYDNGETDEGAAYLYHGTATGLAATASWTQEGNQASAYFGFSVAGAGDVNGDGNDDVIVGAPNYDNGETDEGYAFFYTSGL